MAALLLIVIYISFIGLGIPDSLFGTAWPAIYAEFHLPISWASFVSVTICCGTVVSSMVSAKVIRVLGTNKVAAVSTAMTAAALLGFSLSGNLLAMCLWAVPLGLGAGAIDTALNNYVALHYASRHMSWLHCMWGVGASVGPYIMGYALTGGGGWNMGYRYIALMQVALTLALLLSLPLWKAPAAGGTGAEERSQPLTLGRIFRIPGVKAVMAAFFCYCALEQTTGLWASSYLVLQKGVPAETAASFASLFFIGITVGRALSGFLTMKLNDAQMIRLGEGIIGVGAAAFLLPLGEYAALGGLILIGLGCAPIYPCIIHGTPEHFGADKSQAIIGVQMASAYAGNCLMPPLFGLIATHIHVALFPFYLLAILIVMAVMHEALVGATGRRGGQITVKD